jgi:hypothetical protein
VSAVEAVAVDTLSAVPGADADAVSSVEADVLDFCSLVASASALDDLALLPLPERVLGMVQSRELFVPLRNSDSLGVAACPAGGVMTVVSPELIISSASLLGLFQSMPIAIVARRAMENKDNSISSLNFMGSTFFRFLSLAASKLLVDKLTGYTTNAV